jgi:hypothetical protein
MDNRDARIGALRKYISLLRREEDRLDGVKGSPRASQQERDEAEACLRATAQKITSADKELRGLEARPGVRERRA